jgi:uncharacterized protein (TIGR02246 family)
VTTNIRLLNRCALLLVSALFVGCGPRSVTTDRPPARTDGDGKAARQRGGDEMDQASKPQQPQDWPGLFTRRLNAGDLDGAVALYEPEARFVTRSGETLVGRDKVRRVLAGLIGAKTRMQSKVVQAVTVGDVAVLYTDFEGTTVESSGKTVEIRSKAIEVLRRQPDGAWRLIVGDPDGRSRE